VIAFLLLILMNGQQFDIKMAEIGTMDACLKLRGEVMAVMPKQKGVAYFLECVTLRDTMETPA
jgi:hypothetical protein